MQHKPQLCVLGASVFKLAPPLSDNPHGMQHIVFNSDWQLFVSNTKQQFRLLSPRSDIWHSTTVLVVLHALQ